ncbi:MAG TPA: DUF3341 domain-containing protein [Planctomycetota bacterium]
MLAMAEIKPLLHGHGEQKDGETGGRGDGETSPTGGESQELRAKSQEPETKGATEGLLAEYESPQSLLHAAAAVRDAGYTKWDAHTPYAVHGLDKAMGLRPTPLPLLVFAAGVTGALAGLGLQWFCNTFDYPLLISGKPLFSVPANIPVMFETTILFASLGAVLGMFALNRLPELYSSLFKRPRFRRATDDRFFISIEAKDAQFHVEQTAELLRAHGALAVETLED